MPVANIAVVGAGWWSQGWHLPHLSRNEGAQIVAIVDKSEHPKSNLNPNLESLSSLSLKYSVPVFSSVDELLLPSSNVGAELDGVIVATPHATHYEIGKRLLEFAMQRMKDNPETYRPLNIFLEKPATTDVVEAHELHELWESCKAKGLKGCFLINHSANYREQIKKARETIEKLGPIRHITGFMASPLSWLFDQPELKGWNSPSKSMIGNGFCWGQSSHLLGWIFHVCPDLKPVKVFCAMNHSYTSEADVSHAATIICRDKEKQAETIVSISGTCLLPGYEHSDTPVGKRLDIKIFGANGCIMYSGNDADPSSGRLEYSNDGTIQVLSDSFQFENCEVDGAGPESLQNFIQACNNQNYYCGADTRVGLLTVMTIDAMYRSNASRVLEDVKHFD